MASVLLQCQHGRKKPQKIRKVHVGGMVVDEEEKSDWAKRLIRKHGARAPEVAEEYAVVHGKAGRLVTRDAWLAVAAAIRITSTDKLHEKQTSAVGADA
jgi:hypothetical protein